MSDLIDRNGFPMVPKGYKGVLIPGAPAWMIRPCGHIEEDFYPMQRHPWVCIDCNPRRLRMNVRDGVITAVTRKN